MCFGVYGSACTRDSLAHPPRNAQRHTFRRLPIRRHAIVWISGTFWRFPTEGSLVCCSFLQFGIYCFARKWEKLFCDLNLGCCFPWLDCDTFGESRVKFVIAVLVLDSFWVCWWELGCNISTGWQRKIISGHF